jgi:hypothetical protein
MGANVENEPVRTALVRASSKMTVTLSPSKRFDGLSVTLQG